MQFNLRRIDKKSFSVQTGFTLIEIIIATAIFISTVSGILVLFNYTLRINREVQVSRQVTQGSRNFTEILTREIRNGRIDYNSPNANCDKTNYLLTDNQSLGILTSSGDQLCFYLNGNLLYIAKGASGSPEVINPDKLVINDTNFRFLVRPETDPTISISGDFPGIQPMVSITAEFKVQAGNESLTIPYQTTISTDVYDIPHKDS